MVFNIFVPYDEQSKILLNYILDNKVAVRRKEPDLKVVGVGYSDKSTLKKLKKLGVEKLPAIQKDTNIICGNQNVKDYICCLVKPQNTSHTSSRSAALDSYDDFKKSVLSSTDDTETPIDGEKPVSTNGKYEKTQDSKPDVSSSIELDNTNNLPKPIPREQNLKKPKEPVIDVSKCDSMETAEEAFLQNLASGHF